MIAIITSLQSNEKAANGPEETVVDIAKGADNAESSVIPEFLSMLMQILPKQTNDAQVSEDLPHRLLVDSPEGEIKAPPSAVALVASRVAVNPLTEMEGTTGILDVQTRVRTTDQGEELTGSKPSSGMREITSAKSPENEKSLIKETRAEDRNTNPESTARLTSPSESSKKSLEQVHDTTRQSIKDVDTEDINPRVADSRSTSEPVSDQENVKSVVKTMQGMTKSTEKSVTTTKSEVETGRQDENSFTPIRTTLTEAPTRNAERGKEEALARTSTVAAASINESEQPEPRSEVSPSDANNATSDVNVRELLKNISHDLAAIANTNRNDEKSSRLPVQGSEPIDGNAVKEYPDSASSDASDNNPENENPAHSPESTKEGARESSFFTHVQSAKGGQGVESTPRVEKPTPTPMNLTDEVTESIIDQVARELSLRIGERGSEIRLRLKPETLGEVLLNIRLEGGSVSARIDVSQAAVKGILESHLVELRSALQSQGVDVRSIEIVAQGQTGSPDARSQNRTRSNSQGRRRFVMQGAEQYQSARDLGYNTIEIII